MKIKMHITNADLQVGAIKINNVSSSAVVILGDSEEIKPKSVSVTRGIQAPLVVTPSGPGGPVGAIR